MRQKPGGRRKEDLSPTARTPRSAPARRPQRRLLCLECRTALSMGSMRGRHEPNAAAMRAAAAAGFSTATDLADWLVRVLGLPFREAHHVTGRIVAAAETSRVTLDKLPLQAMQLVEPRITKEVLGVLSVENSLKSRVTYGGTAPQNVRKMARNWIKRLEKPAGRV